MNTAIIMDMMFNTEMIVKDMKGGKEDMTEKRLCKFSLNGFQCLVFYRLIKEGKRIILVGDNEFKVVDGDVE